MTIVETETDRILTAEAQAQAKFEAETYDGPFTIAELA